MIEGLKLKTPDSRDLKMGAIFDMPSPSELPDEFVLNLPRVLSQGNTDFCTAAASGSLVEIHEQTPLAWQWVFAVGKLLEGGDVDSFGLELRTVCKVLTKYGIPEVADLPAGFLDHDPDFLRRIENWPPELYNKALKHRQGSYIDVTGMYDIFDDIRTTIFKFKENQNGVLLGVLWSWSLSQIIMETEGQGQFGHAICSVGWKTVDGKPYLFIQNSYGEEAGEKGRHYFSREVINNNVDKYGAFMFHDLLKDEINKVITDRQGLKLSLIQRILRYIKKYLDSITK